MPAEPAFDGIISDMVDDAMRRRESRQLYQRSDFREVPNPRTGKRGSYLNLITGEIVGRRLFQKLIGRPLPGRSRVQARAKVGRDLERNGILVTEFAATITDASGRNPRTRYRTMRNPTYIDPEDLEGFEMAMRAGNLEGASRIFYDALIRTWWNGGAAVVDEVDGLAFRAASAGDSEESEE